MVSTPSYLILSFLKSLVTILKKSVLIIHSYDTWPELVKATGANELQIKKDA